MVIVLENLERLFILDQLEHFAKLINGWFWETDSDLRFTYLSESVTLFTGLVPEWHYGKLRTEWRSDGISDENWAKHLNDLESRRPFYDFVFCRVESNGTRWMSTSGEPIFNEFEEFLGYRGVTRDITSQMELSDKADKSKAQLLTALEIMDEGFVYYDADGRLVMCNEKYREYYPLSKHLMVPGAKFEDIIREGVRKGQHPDAIGREEEWVEERLAVHKSGNSIVEQKLKDGRWLRMAEQQMPDGSVVGMRIDITRLKIAQENAETASLAKSNFLSTMSHEIRTPLNGVLGLAQLLADTALDQDQKKKVATILSSGQTLLAIINDVLDMSKIEAGGLELEDKVFSLPGLVSTIATPFQSLADDKGIELAVSYEIDSSMVIKGDTVRLRQILWNLLSNAIKFTDYGRVQLTIELVIGKENIGELVSSPKDHLVCFAVEDTGAGIAPDRVDAIFDAFTQEDSTITRKHGGTGLGLSIVKELIKLMGGTVRVDSALGEGTKFIAYLPFDAAAAEETEEFSLRAPNSEGQKGKPLNILIAEDNEVNAIIAKAFLDKFGHSVRHVENGRLAVEAAKDDWADLILMDIHMPEMNGVDATKAIRETDIGKTIPIIGLTAEAFADRHAMFIEAGMVDVLTKPFTEQQLADTLAANRLIERRSRSRD